MYSVCPPPCVSPSMFVPLYVCPPRYVSTSVCDPLCVCPPPQPVSLSVCVSYFVCVPFRVCPSPCVYPIPCVYPTPCLYPTLYVCIGRWPRIIQVSQVTSRYCPKDVWIIFVMWRAQATVPITYSWENARTCCILRSGLFD